MFSDPSMPPILAECYKLFPSLAPFRDTVEDCLPTEQSLHQISALEWRKQMELDQEIHIVFDSLQNRLKMKFEGWKRPTHCFPLRSLLIDGVRYSDHLSKTPGNSLAFFRSSTGKFVPGKIRQIFWIPVDAGGGRYIKAFFCAIHRYFPLSPSSKIRDPFYDYPSFKASLWSEELSHEVDVIESSEPIYPAIRQQWISAKGEEGGISVFKRLSRGAENSFS